MSNTLKPHRVKHNYVYLAFAPLGGGFVFRLQPGLRCRFCGAPVPCDQLVGNDNLPVLHLMCTAGHDVVRIERTA